MTFTLPAAHMLPKHKRGATVFIRSTGKQHVIERIKHEPRVGFMYKLKDVLGAYLEAELQ